MKKIIASVAFVAMMVCAAACCNNQKAAEGEACACGDSTVVEAACDSCAAEVACDSAVVAE